MQREIKFRAWDPINKRMISSVGFTDSDIGRIWRQEGYMMGESSVDLRQVWIPVQYTGLKDKNGKEIYEGDVVQYRNEDKKDFGERFLEVTMHTGCEYSISQWTIVGNIYEMCRCEEVYEACYIHGKYLPRK